MNQFNQGRGLPGPPQGPPHVMQGVNMGLPQEIHFLRSRVQSLELSVQELQKESCEYRMHIQNLQNELKEVKYQQAQPVKVVIKNPAENHQLKDKPGKNPPDDANPRKDKKPNKYGGDGASATPPSANPDKKKNKNKQKKGAGGDGDASNAPRNRSIDSRHSECATPINMTGNPEKNRFERVNEPSFDVKSKKSRSGRVRDHSLESSKSSQPSKQDKYSYRNRHDSSSSSSSSCPSENSDCNESVASSLSHEMIGKFDFIWCFNDIKGAWRRAKSQNKKFKEIVSRELCSDQDGYLFRLHLYLCGSAGYFTYDKFICAGLSTSSPSSNSKLKWPTRRSFILAIVNPVNEDDILISKKRDRIFKALNKADWIYNFCSLDNIFGFQRDFSSRFTSGDKLHVGIKFL